MCTQSVGVPSNVINSATKINRLQIHLPMQIIKLHTDSLEQYAISRIINSSTEPNTSIMSAKLPKHIQRQLDQMEDQQDYERTVAMQRKFDRYRMNGMSKKDAIGRVMAWEDKSVSRDIDDLIEAEDDLLAQEAKKKSM